MHTSSAEFMVFLPILMFLFILPITIVLVVLPFWFICKKAGFHPALSLLMLVPMGNIILPFVLAFADWPAMRERQELPAGGQADNY